MIMHVCVRVHEYETPTSQKIKFENPNRAKQINPSIHTTTNGRIFAAGLFIAFHVRQ